VSEQISKEGSN